MNICQTNTKPWNKESLRSNSITKATTAPTEANSGPTEEKAVTYQTGRRQAFRGVDQSDDHLHTAGSFVPAVSELALILFLKRRLQDEDGN